MPSKNYCLHAKFLWISLFSRTKFARKLRQYIITHHDTRIVLGLKKLATTWTGLWSGYWSQIIMNWINLSILHRLRIYLHSYRRLIVMAEPTEPTVSWYFGLAWLEKYKAEMSAHRTIRSLALTLAWLQF